MHKHIQLYDSADIHSYVKQTKQFDSYINYLATYLKAKFYVQYRLLHGRELCGQGKIELAHTPLIKNHDDYQELYTPRNEYSKLPS